MNPIAIYQGIDKGVRIAYWGSVVAIIIALILIIISITLLVQNSTIGGIILLIFGGIIGGIGVYTFRRTNKSTSGFIIDEGKSAFEKAKSQFSQILGKSEESGKNEFDENLIEDVKEDDCGCSTTGGKRVEFDEDINEMDYVESSDEEAENPFEDEENNELDLEKSVENEDNENNEDNKKIPKKPQRKKNKKSKKSSKGGDEDQPDEEDQEEENQDNETRSEEYDKLLQSLKSILDNLKEAEPEGDNEIIQELCDQVKKISGSKSDVLDFLDQLMANINILNETYKKLDENRKREVRNLSNFPSYETDDIKIKLEEFKEELTA